MIKTGRFSALIKQLFWQPLAASARPGPRHPTDLPAWAEKSTDSAFFALSALVLIIGMSVTGLLWQDEERNIQVKARLQFSQMGNDLRGKILARMTSYEIALQSAVALWSTQGEVSRDNWKTFISNTGIIEKCPGITSIGWAPFLRPSDVAGHIRAVRADGLKDYALHPAGERDIFTAVTYQEPVTAFNQKVFGYDMYADATRKAAMDLARDTGQASLSGKVTLLRDSETDRQSGALMYLPVYWHDTTKGTEAARRADIRGVVYAVFRLNDFMAGVLDRDNDLITLRLYDGPAPGPETMIFQSPPRPVGDGARYHTREALDFANHRWTMEVTGTEAFAETENDFGSHAILVGGVGISALFFTMLQSLARSRAKAITLARQMSAKALAGEARTRAIIDNIADGIIITDDRGVIQWFTPSAERIFGWTPAEAIGQNVTILMPAPPTDAREGWVERRFGGTEARLIGAGQDLLVRHKNGTTVPIELHVSEFSVDGQRLFAGVVRDISERKRAEAANRLAAGVFHSTAEGIVVTDLSGTILAVNQAFTDITGYSEAEAIGQTPRMMKSDHHDRRFFADLWRSLSSDGHWKGEIWNRRKNGEAVLLRQTINMIKDENEQPIRYVSVFRDITELRQKDDHIHHLAFHDALTGLANRALLLDRIGQTLAVAAREERRAALLFLDLDRFKYVNDTLGHDIGDRLLKTVAQRLLALVRTTDTVARLGGDEFVILLHAPRDHREVFQVSERIADAIRLPMDLDGHKVQVGTSVGIALYPDDGMDAETLMKRADMAMYAAKASGKTGF